MIKEKHNMKLTKNERRVLDYIIEKAEQQHALTVEVVPTELMDSLHFKSLMTSYNVVKKLIEKKLITKLGDELTLDADLFVFQKDTRVKKTLNLKFVLQELETEQTLFPFLEPSNRVKYMQMVAANKEEAMKYNPQLTLDVCRLVEQGVFEFPLKPLKGNPLFVIPMCINIIATCHCEEQSSFRTYEDRELRQAVDYLRGNPKEYHEIACNYGDYSKEFVEFLFDKYINGKDNNGKDNDK